MSVDPPSEKFNIVSNQHGLIKPILQNLTHLIQYTVLEIQFWSVNCTTVTVRYAKISSMSITSHQAMQDVAIFRIYENKPLQNAFKHN